MNERGLFSREDDDSDKDEDDDKDTVKTNKKTTRLPRHVPGIRVGAGENGQANKKEEKIKRLVDSLFKEKDEKSKEEDEEESKDGEESDSVTTVEDANETAPTQTDIPTVTESLETADTDLTEEEPEQYQASDAESRESWEEEGKLGEDAEISLQTRNVPEVNEPVEIPEDVAIEEEEPVVAEDDGGSEAPPPDSPEDTPEDVPEPRPTPRTDSSGGAYFPPYAAERRRTPAEDARAYEEALNDAEYYGRKQGQNKGVVAGLAAGLYIGHRRKKSQGKQYEAKLHDRDTKIKKLQDEQAVASERLKAIKRTQKTMQSAIVERGWELSPAPLEALSRRQEAREPFIASVLEGNKVEKNRFSPHAEKEHGKELLPEDQEITEDMYHTVDGHRIETSSWHRIEIDAKTGRPVENPEVEYGEEFKRETRREILRDEPKDIGSAAVQLGSVATTASVRDSQVSQQRDISASPDSYVPPPAAPLAGQVRSNVRNPLIWAAALVLVLILFIFVLG